MIATVSPTAINIALSLLPAVLLAPILYFALRRERKSSNAATLTEEDVEALRKETSKLQQRLFILPLISIFLLFVTAAIEFHSARRFTDIAGITMDELHKDVGLSKQYSGAFIRASDSFSIGNFTLAMAAFGSVLFPALLYGRKLRTRRTARILKFIDEKGL